MYKIIIIYIITENHKTHKAAADRSYLLQQYLPTSVDMEVTHPTFAADRYESP